MPLMLNRPLGPITRPDRGHFLRGEASRGPITCLVPGHADRARGSARYWWRTTPAGSKKAQRKRRRPTSKDDRKSNKKPNKSKQSETSVSNVSGGDVSLTQIQRPSLEEMMASDTPVNRSHDSLLDTCPTQSTPHGASSSAAPNDEEPRVPVRRSGATLLTVVKHQWSEALKEIVPLRNSIALIETDIDTKNKELVWIRKCDTAQKSEIKKLTKVADEQKGNYCLINQQIITIVPVVLSSWMTPLLLSYRVLNDRSIGLCPF